MLYRKHFMNLSFPSLIICLLRALHYAGTWQLVSARKYLTYLLTNLVSLDLHRCAIKTLIYILP